MAVGATILGCLGTGLSASEAAFFRDADPFGFILFARNIENPQQVARLTASLRAAVGRDAPVMVDQEGGRVQRLRAPHWYEWLPPLDQMAATREGAAARAVWLRYRLIAEELRACGIDANCAPTADIACAQTHPFLHNRCFGTDAATVTLAARACAEGLLAGGVLPVMKHLPGHGRASADSHQSLPRVDASRADLLANDFAPFAALADLPMAMTAHIVFTALDADRPATASPLMISLIRQEIGFGGLLMTDDIGMHALTGGFGARAAAALAAGCDLVLHCNGDMAEMQAVAAASGCLTPAATTRAQAALAQRGKPAPIDSTALRAELLTLLHTGG
ncbi:beta-N-acetylhexosaminidase [Frigidibacter albus]|uniref:beta-N-acetylhexosaminidase n=1 Tax=Frigidibacter mobilis TaxID=1335048 RepID=A0A159Z3T6_9RHOB|nr:beta-N-acetylhexosaminidase [Frigidibacter mobilis]AMY69771.1 beta-hexosaminidase, putative [Frigidibacter mobilis]